MTPSGIEPATFRLVSAVPQPTATPRDPNDVTKVIQYINEEFGSKSKVAVSF